MEYSSGLAASDFSLAESGRLNSVLRWFHLDKDTPGLYVKRSVTLVAVTWVPLLILSALQHLAWGDFVKVNFLSDFSIHSRLILILPILIFSEFSVDARLRKLTRQFFRAGILGEKDLPALDGIKKRIKQLSDTVIADWVMLAIVIVNIVVRWTSNLHNVSIWMLYPDDQGGHMSWAGAWYVFVSLPILQYILLRWFWRWILWVIYFAKIARLPLRLNSAHPDKAGGIGFLGLPPAPFLNVTLALSLLFSTSVAVRIFWLHQTLPQYYPLMAGFAFLCILMNVLPLVVFARPMIKQRRKGIFEYSSLLQKHHQQFDEKWLGKKDVNELLGSQDASSTTDLNTTFDVVQSMGKVPFNYKTMLSSIVIAVLPMLPLLAFEYDWVELLKKVAGMLF